MIRSEKISGDIFYPRGLSFLASGRRSLHFMGGLDSLRQKKPETPSSTTAFAHLALVAKHFSWEQEVSDIKTKQSKEPRRLFLPSPTEVKQRISFQTRLANRKSELLPCLLTISYFPIQFKVLDCQPHPTVLFVCLFVLPHNDELWP